MVGNGRGVALLGGAHRPSEVVEDPDCVVDCSGTSHRGVFRPSLRRPGERERVIS